MIIYSSITSHITETPQYDEANVTALRDLAETNHLEEAFFVLL
jgi:hypothetical protein